MRGSVVAADIGLELDDAPYAPAGRVMADEACADERARRFERRAREQAPVDSAQARG